MTQTSSLPLRIREADLTEEADRSFVLDAWLKSYRKSHWAGVVPNNSYIRVYTDAIMQLLERGMVVLLLEGTELDTYAGFVAFERATIPVLHYIYVKEVLRGHKLAKMLLFAAGIRPDERFFYTFRTKSSKRLKSGIYAPVIARRKEFSKENGWK